MISIYNQKKLASDLTRVIKSSQLSRGVRACLLMTRDRDYAMNILKETIVACNQPLYHYTIASRRRYNPEQLKWNSVGGGLQDPTDLLQEAGKLDSGGVVVFEDCAAFLRDENGDRKMRMTLAQMLSSENESQGLVLVFMEPPESESRLPSILADQFVRLDVPYPRADELEIIARSELIRIARHANISMDIETVKTEAIRLSTGVVGLTRSAAKDALKDALAPDPQNFDAAFKQLQIRKSMQLSRELAMNVLDTVNAEEPIGLDYLVEYLKTTRRLIYIYK